MWKARAGSCKGACAAGGGAKGRERTAHQAVTGGEGSKKERSDMRGGCARGTEQIWSNIGGRGDGGTRGKLTAEEGGEGSRRARRRGGRGNAMEERGGDGGEGRQGQAGQ